MRITVGVTDHAWAAYLRDRPDLYEVNFWVPSGRSFMGRAQPDEPFRYKTKSRPSPLISSNTLVGGGFYVRFWLLRVSEAWAVFEQGNGCESEQELHQAIRGYRSGKDVPSHPDPTIGCIVLRNPFFAGVGDELPQPPH